MPQSNHILHSPLVTEKAIASREQGKYWFWVSPKATKDQIAAAFKTVFKENVLSVKTSILKGKVKTNWNTRKTIQKPTRKKALIVISKGKKLDILEIKKD